MNELIMELGFSYQELALLIISSFAVLGLLIAVLDFDSVNNVCISYLGWTKQIYKTSNSSKYILASFFRIPSYLGDITKNAGWKSGLSILGLGFTLLFFGITLFSIGILIGLWPVLKWVFIVLLIILIIRLFSS